MGRKKATALTETEARAIISLARHSLVPARAAKELYLSRATLYYYCQKIQEIPVHCVWR